MQRSLPEMNLAKQSNQFPYQVFAFHRGSENEKASKIISGKDAQGREWVLDFVWSTPEFEKQLGGVRGLPSYYVIDSTGRARAVVKGHSKDTLATLKWLVEQVDTPTKASGNKG